MINLMALTNDWQYFRNVKALIRHIIFYLFLKMAILSWKVIGYPKSPSPVIQGCISAYSADILASGLIAQHFLKKLYAGLSIRTKLTSYACIDSIKFS